MHILILPSWYKTPQNPVVGTFFEEQARMFLKRGHQVGVLYPRHELRFLGITRFGLERTPHVLADNGIPTYYSFTESIIPKVPYPTALDVSIVNKRAMRVYREYVNKYGKPDILHAHSTLWGGVVAKYISYKENIPYYLTKHFTGWVLFEKYRTIAAYNRLLEAVTNKSEETFVVSSFYKDQLLDNYRLNEHKLTVLPNIINSVFTNGESPIIKLKGRVNLIVIGYLIERKNHLTLFNAIQILRDKSIEIKLNVVGDGPFREVLETYVAKEGLKEIIHFRGLLDREEVLNQIQASHILVSTSTFETFGVNIIEALAVGRPVVVYDSGGPRDIVRPEDGILFNENTPEAVAHAIKFAIENYSSYDQRQIAEACEARFGEEVIYRRLMEYFKGV